MGTASTFVATDGGGSSNDDQMGASMEANGKNKRRGPILTRNALRPIRYELPVASAPGYKSAIL